VTLAVSKSFPLKGVLPLFVAKENGVSPDLDKLKWWKNHHLELPHWLAKKCFTYSAFIGSS
jgi:hypothetical protein